MERRGDDIAGMAVHIAARVEAAASPGVHQFKGVDDDWQLHAVASIPD